VVITLSTDHAVAGQEIGVAADFSIAKGWHIYGQPLPANYAPTAIVFDSDCVAKQSFDYPDPGLCGRLPNQRKDPHAFWNEAWRLQAEGHAQFSGMQRSDLQDPAVGQFRDSLQDRSNGVASAQSFK
jgi:hypothetical protein